MKSFVFTFLFFCGSFVFAQNEEVRKPRFPEDSLLASKIVMQDAGGDQFNYLSVVGELSSAQIAEYFRIPKEMATQYPLQVFYIRNFETMEQLEQEDLMGISVFSTSPEKTAHHFFNFEKGRLVEDKNYAVDFNNGIFCSFYADVFMLELSEVNYKENNPAIFLIYNKDVPFHKKSDEEQFLLSAYNGFFGLKDYKTPQFLEIEKAADSLGFTFVAHQELEPIAEP